MSETCFQCGNEYKRISQHWSLSDCSEPELSEKKLEIIKGLLMGDATLANRNKTPYVQCTMTNRKYLEHLSNIFKASSDITKNKTAKQSAEEDRNSGFNPKAEKSSYKDVYRWATITRNEYERFSNWYTSEGKKFPKNLNLTPLCLKHWYVCDGGIGWSSPWPSVEFYSKNELHRIEHWVERFNDLGFECRKSSEGFRIPHGELDDFFDWLGSVPSGFEYKFEYSSRERYDELKKEVYS